MQLITNAVLNQAGTRTAPKRAVSFAANFSGPTIESVPISPFSSISGVGFKFNKSSLNLNYPGVESFLSSLKTAQVRFTYGPIAGGVDGAAFLYVPSTGQSIEFPSPI